MGDSGGHRPPGKSPRRLLALVLGPALFSLFLLLPAPRGLGPAGMRVAGVALWMVSWWIGEVIPLAATALLPLVLFPLLGVMGSKQVAPYYADHNIFLFLGGFLIALGIERWGLHRRLALLSLRLFGRRVGPGSWEAGQRRLVLVFMVVTALLSMWVSNTATTLMILPIATAVLHGREDGADRSRLDRALLLGVAYAASIGGLGTLIGTPPNIVLAGQVSELVHPGASIGFGQWMLMGIPLVAVMLPLAWWYLVGFAVRLPAGAPPVRLDLQAAGGAPGPLSRGEKTVLAVFALTALGWCLRKPFIAPWFPGVTDASLAVGGALLLFVIPVDWAAGVFALDWKQAERVPWGVLLLFGGGFALAAGMQQSGLAHWLSLQLGGLSGLPLPLLLLLVALLMAGLTELASNTAITTTMLPILAPAARALGLHPLTLMVPATLAASCAFMLPAATPPNAIVFGTGRIRLPEMFRVGLGLEIIGALVITLLVWALAGPVFGSLPVAPVDFLGGLR